MNAIATRALVIFALLTASAAAAEYSDLYIIPGGGHSRGAFGTLWRSDVVLHNVQTVPITVEIAIVESGRSASTAPIAVTVDGQASVHLNPGETRTLSDVTGSLGRDISGALIVGADLPFALTSRAYAEVPAGRTLGQMIMPVAITGAADAVNAIAVLPSLGDSAGQRSNVGVFAAASQAPLTVEIAVLSASGATLGSRLVVVDEPGFVHRQVSLAQIIAPAASVTAVVRILEGDGIVVPYGSIIDNTTAEAVFVSGEAISARGAATRSMLARAVAIDEVR